MVCTFKIDPSFLDTAPLKCADLIEEGSNVCGQIAPAKGLGYRPVNASQLLKNGSCLMASAAALLMSNYPQLRQAMVDSQLKVTKVTDEGVIAAMNRVPRELFVPPDRQAMAYVDENLAFAPGRVIMQPVVLARLMSAASPRWGDKALVVGAGLGYTAAVLADIGLAVTALEGDAALATQAKAALEQAGYPHVDVQHADPLTGYAAAAPYDLILLDGAVEVIPDAIVNQLAETGTLIAVLVENGVGRGVVGRKSSNGEFGATPFMDALLPVMPGFQKPRTFSF
jgi:protein-L-isoaspartate(D-aspartate) O-methyltransferase